MSEAKITAKGMTDQRFDALLKQIRDYAKECNDTQKIIQYLDKLMEDVRGGKKRGLKA